MSDIAKTLPLTLLLLHKTANTRVAQAERVNKTDISRLLTIYVMGV